LPVQHFAGELDDAAALREAMDGVDTVYYCIVDTRAWLRDAAPLFHTNVDGLRHALDAAVDARVGRFVFCSTVGTIGLSQDGPADEDVAHDWVHLGGPYIQSRVEAENLVLRYCRERELPGIVMCVSTTYGAPDYGSPHGRMVSDAALGKLPLYFGGNASMEVVGVEDAARAFLLAAEKGRIGERYIVSERFMSWKELVTIAAEAVGARPPRVGIPLALLKVIGRAGDVAARLLRRDVVMNSVSVRLLHLMPPLDHTKASHELGWQPSPTPDAIRGAARFYVEQHRQP
jgi:dihydroflavonol-4-reductase